MTSEVRYIIENRKFKKTLVDYFDHFEFIFVIMVPLKGVLLLYEGGGVIKYVLGTMLILSTFPLAKFMSVRHRQLYEFEEIESKGTSEENFVRVLQGLKTLNIVELDRDFLNVTINAKYKATSLIPPFIEWLTIVSLDDKILVNSRPFPPSRIMWFRRNAMIDFVNSLNNASE